MLRTDARTARHPDECTDDVDRPDPSRRHTPSDRPRLPSRKGSLMSIVLYHHPFSRASAVVWMLEEVGVPHELRYVDIMAGAHKAPEIVALNPMGKLPT